MDPLSITASIISIITAAVQSVQFLTKTIDNIKDAPDTVKVVSSDLTALQLVLHNLQKALQDGTEQILPSSQIKQAVENCDRACNTFCSQVEHWKRRSKEEKMFWMDKWRVGLFGLERIKTFRAQLGDCKATLNVALSTATVITTSRQETLMKEMKDMMLQHNEVVVRQQLARADIATDELECSIQQLTTSKNAELSPTTQQTDVSNQSRRELLHELAYQNSANDTFKAVCEEAISTTVFERTGQKIKGVKATNHSSAVTGFINASEQAAKIEQDILDVIAEDWSIAVAGVMDNVDFRDLLPIGAHTRGL